jgi:glycosyltransferase involved in cell wall biosynthesis
VKISVILSTYEQPWALERVLTGYALQSMPDFELVIADDGSGPETRAVIERIRSDTRLDPVHVRHEDRGFRKTEILNRAILASGGDYLVFSDGDCIPRPDFVEVHARLAAPGRYVSGGYLKLPEQVSDAIGLDEVRDGSFADLEWLRNRGWRPGRRALRLTKSPGAAWLFDVLTPTRTQFGGHNASTWREALLEVNGFDCRMGYGGLDLALGMRLRNLGLKGIQARFRAICMHLHHARPYKDPLVLQRNREILSRIEREREVRAKIGLAEVAGQPGGLEV